MIHLEGELMRARILRQFHPVGQGAFYTEHIIAIMKNLMLFMIAVLQQAKQL